MAFMEALSCLIASLSIHDNWEGKQAVEDDLRRWIILAQEDDDLLQGVDIGIIFHEKIVGANHDEDDMRIGNLILDRGQPVQQALGGFTGNTEVDDLEMGYSCLPVKAGNQRISKEKQSALLHICAG